MKMTIGRDREISVLEHSATERRATTVWMYVNGSPESFSRERPAYAESKSRRLVPIVDLRSRHNGREVKH
jgi:hypothetical protein